MLGQRPLGNRRMNGKNHNRWLVAQGFGDPPSRLTDDLKALLADPWQGLFTAPICRKAVDVGRAPIPSSGLDVGAPSYRYAGPATFCFDAAGFFDTRGGLVFGQAVGLPLGHGLGLGN